MIYKWLMTSLMALGLLLASCTSGVAPTATPRAIVPTPAGAPSTPPTAPTPTPKPASTPRFGGILTVSTAGDPPSLDSQQENTINTQMVVAPAYNHIVAYDKTTGKTIVPELAESWQMSPDGTTYTFKVRQGVKWHDGQSMTAEDLAYNVQKIAFPPAGIRSNIGYMFADATQRIEAPDVNTLRITLKYPYALLITSLATDNGAHMFPKHLLENDMKALMKQVVGTGPFKLRTYSPGTLIEHVKNKDFWVKDRPYLDGVTFYIIKDSSTRIAALRTGRVKRTGTRFSALTAAQMESVKATNPNMRFVPEICVMGPGFFMNIRRPPFNDIRVRKAVSLVLDRQAALKTLANGQGMISRYFPYEGWGIPEEELLKMPGYTQPKDADRAEARKLLAEAGYADGFPLTILSRLMPVASDAAVFMSNQLSTLGIKSTVQTMEDAPFWAAGREGRHQAMVFTPGALLPDPYYISRTYEPGGAANYSGNDDDKKMLEMSQQEVRTVDVDKRKGLVREIDRYLNEESLIWVSIVWPYVFYGVSPDVQNMILGVVTDNAQHDFQEVWLSQQDKV